MYAKSGLIQFENQGGILRGYYADDAKSLDSLFLVADSTSGFCTRRMAYLAQLIEDRYERVGLLAHIFVPQHLRGTGVGRSLMQQFESQIMPHTDIDIVFASVLIHQENNFNLKEFYERHGFRAVSASNGELLMVTKGAEQELIPGLSTVRKASEFEPG